MSVSYYSVPLAGSYLAHPTKPYAQVQIEIALYHWLKTLNPTSSCSYP